MSREVTVTVLQEDIDNGKPGDPSLCAVACAVRRELGALEAIVSSAGIVMVLEPGSTVSTPPLPGDARQFISDFDRGSPVGPFKFGTWLSEVPWPGRSW